MDLLRERPLARSALAAGYHERVSASSVARIREKTLDNRRLAPEEVRRGVRFAAKSPILVFQPQALGDAEQDMIEVLG
ncbi:MAG: hypothetical protein ACRD16_07420, partial [Thermoanaerobaculia bacterium]